MFFKRFLINAIFVTIVIAIACYLNEKIGFSIYGFEFTSLNFTNPLTYAAILVLSIVLSLMWGFNIGFLKKAGILVILVFVLMLVFDFYYNTNKDEKTGKYEIERKEQVEKETIVSSDTLHVGLKTIYLLSSGGTIDATCDNNGFIIKIESQNNLTSGSWSRLIYSFDTRNEYLDAIDYINKKGYRWIINHQFENEYSWNANHQISYEGSGSSMRTINTMTLSQITKVN